MNVKSIFFFSGINGPKQKGNQSLKNTLEGYIESGYRVYVFDMLSSTDPTFAFKQLEEKKNFFHIGMPNVLLSLLKRLAILAKRRKSHSRALNSSYGIPPSIESVIDLGNSEITAAQIYTARLYTIFEIIRSSLFVWLIRPEIIYGFEIYGAQAASFWKRFGYSKKVILRFMGTYITEGNRSNPFIRYHLRCLGGASDGIVMTNDGTRGDEVLQSLNIPNSRIFFAINGVDGNIRASSIEAIRNARDKMNPQNRKYIAGIFNRFYPFKRIDRAIRLHQQWRKNGIDVQLAIAGHGGPLVQQLHSLVENLDTGNYVTWLDSIPHSEMAAHYQACDVSLLMNDYANMGNQLMENLFLGVPVLAVDDGKNSVVFGDCPYARFSTPSLLSNISLNEISRLKIDAGRYSNSSLVPWTVRIAREIEWVQEL